MSPQILAQIQQLERRLDDVSNRVQTILDEGFGPEPVDTLENNLNLLEKKIHEARADRQRVIQERDAAQEKATRAWEENLRLDSENRRLERESGREELRAALQDRHDFHWALKDAKRERDEARAELARLAGKLDAMHEANKKLQRERDQLRADIADLLHEPPLKIPLTTTP